MVWRAGADIHPIDVDDERETRWLRALIWPEHQDRMALLDAALAWPAQYPQRIVAGDAGETLPALLAEAPADATLCVYHGFTLNQMPAATRERILSRVAEYSHEARSATAWRWSGGRRTDADRRAVYRMRTARRVVELLARCEGHGRWVEWLAR